MPGKLDPEARISPARRAAFEVLEQVLNSGAHSDDLLHGPALAALSPTDRNLTTALVLGTLRWKLALDAELIPLLARPDAQLPSAVATALELGAFQLRHLDRVPAHAVLSESVELTRAAGHAHAAGMVNAILRKLTTQKAATAKLVETPAQFAERLGHPAWMVERWVQRYGRTAAVAICDYGQREPSREPAGDAAQPVIAVVDPGSRLVAELAAALAPESTKEAPLVWDTCAAPGGKTLILAEQLPGASILATDVSRRRLSAMAARIERAGFGKRVRCEAADATNLPEEAGDFDLILCDAPCSGTGTLARNPEIRLRLAAGDLERQAARQRALLGGALRRLRRGGRLLYSTCSLEPEENEAVVEAVAAEFGEAVPLDLASFLADTGQDARLIRNGCLRTLPGANFAGDGFFAAAFERR
jgi:16S rRNA (cytosine967-C5)-methyltransferase